MAATTMMKINVSTARRTVRAISFGVFWRLAPSTRWIMRSRKLSPGLAVARTSKVSEISVVPAVTEENVSVPGSLSTGTQNDLDLTPASAHQDAAICGDRVEDPGG